MSDATCARCGADAGNNWFDRSPCPCQGDDFYGGMMHTRCVECGYAYGECAFEEEAERISAEIEETG